MDQAELYASSNEQQMRDSLMVVREFWSKLNWHQEKDRGNELIIDIGCGSGNVTRDAVWSTLNDEQRQDTLLVGVDVSEKMVTFANTNYATIQASNRFSSIGDSPSFKALLSLEKHLTGLTFAHLDISEELQPLSVYEEVAWKIFSFNCLQWINDQQTVYSNIFRLLQRKGEALLMFVAQHPIREAYRLMASEKAWELLMSDASVLTLPFEMEENQADVMRELLLSIGFEVRCCEVRRMNFKFSSLTKMKNVFKVVTAFQNKIEDEKERRAFVEEVFNKMSDINKKNKLDDSSHDDPLTLQYSLYIIHVIKPDIV